MSLGLFRHWLIILVVYLAMNYPTNDENNISIPPHYPNGELHVGGSWSGLMHSNGQSNNVGGGGGGGVLADGSRHVVDRRIGGSPPRPAKELPPRGRLSMDSSYQACLNAAYIGTIGNITNSSCIGENSCESSAKFGGFEGNIHRSCEGANSCAFAAACPAINQGCGSAITELIVSCYGDSSCHYAVYVGGTIEGIQYSCNAERACYRAGLGEGNNISEGIIDCCNTEKACEEITSDALPETCGTRPSPGPSFTPSRSPQTPTFTPTPLKSPGSSGDTGHQR